MDKQAFATLEFNSLRVLLQRGAQTKMGWARIDALGPMDEQEQLQRVLRETAECIELRQRGGRLSFDGIADPADSISRLRIEGTALDPLAILDLARLCEAAMAARTAILAEREACPALFEIVGALPADLRKLVARVTKKILPGGELDDRASPEAANSPVRARGSRARSKA